MDSLLFAAALLSALLHAAWNAAVKASAAPHEAMAAQMSAAALLALPLLLWAGMPPPAAWPWITVAVLLNLATVQALLRGYQSGAFGSVYPVARASSVLVVAALTPWLMGEQLAAAARAGVLLMVAALLVLAWDVRPQVMGGVVGGVVDGAAGRAALGWALLAGICIALCVLADAHGVRTTAAALAGPAHDPGAGGLRAALSYGATISIGNALLMSLAQRSTGGPHTLLLRQARLAWPAALVSTTSYLLILWVFQHAPIALAAALRDSSALFAMLIAAGVLKEAMPARRLVALVLAMLALPLLRLG